MSTPAPAPRSRKDRDAGLRRAKQLTRLTLAGAIAGTGLFAGLAAVVGGTPASTATKSTQPVTAAVASSVANDDDEATAATATTATTATTPVTVVTSNQPAIVTSGAS